MKKKYILINIKDNGFYLNPMLRIPLEHTNIPTKNFGFRQHHELFWKVELIRYNSMTKVLVLSVEDYEVKDNHTFIDQVPKNEVQFLIFKPLDWKRLEPQLSHYKKSDLEQLLYNLDASPDRLFKDEKPYVPSVRFSSLVSETDIPAVFDSQKEIIRPVTFRKAFNELTILAGCIRFQHNLRDIGNNLEFSIENDHLIPEFNSIKPWFIKKLKAQSIMVNGQITMRGKEVLTVNATSPQIDKIGPSFIEAIKKERTQALTQIEADKVPDRSVFNADEIFDLLDPEDKQGNIFGQTDTDVLNSLLDNPTIRNKRQLNYLSGEKQNLSTPLRYTLDPHFGFVFYYKGQTHLHFIWELLDSHATYIWSIEKKGYSTDQLFRRIESTINKVRSVGREQYKHLYKQGDEDQDLIFHAISHAKIGSDSEDGFQKWCQRLEDHLV